MEDEGRKWGSLTGFCPAFVLRPASCVKQRSSGFGWAFVLRQSTHYWLLSGLRLSSCVLRHGLLLILAAYLTLAALYNAVVPLGEGPDEIGHMNYVLFLAREGRLPVQRPDGAGDVPGQGHHPPLAYALALPAVAWLPADERQVALTANPAFVWNGGSQPDAFVRGSQELWPWRGVVLAWHLARAVSALWGALTVICTWAVARRLGFDQGIALLAAGLVAFNPQFLFMSALVTNDALVALLGALALLAALGRQTTDHRRWTTDDGRWTTNSGQIAHFGRRTPDDGRWTTNGSELTQYGLQSIVRRPSSMVHRLWSIVYGPSSMVHRLWSIVYGLLLGATLALALITKQSALLLLPLLPLTAWLRYGRDWRQGALFLVTNSAVVVLVAGWWYWRNAQLYGDLFGLEAFRAEFLTQTWEWRDPAAWGGALVQLHESFWGRFGWMSVRAPGWWSLLTAALVAGAAVGIVRSLFAANSNERRALLLRYGLLALLPICALVWTFSFALTAGLVAWQGRFLFPTIAPIAVLLAVGVGGLANWRKKGEQEGVRPSYIPLTNQFPAFCILHLACCIPVAVYLALAVVAPAYPWRVVREGTALASLGQPLYLRFAESWKRGVELRGWQQEGNWRPGETVRLTFTWHALEPSSRNWSVFIHLIEGEENVVAESNRQPQNGLAPMKLWTAGDWLRDTHTLELPADLKPGPYTLRVGLFDERSRSWRRQGIWDEKGEFIGSAADLMQVTVIE